MKNKKLLKIVISVVIVIVVLITGTAIYLCDYYHADMETIEAFETENTVEMEKAGDNLVFAQKEAEAGFIFYPGGKVEYTSYIPLMKSLASEGILCVLVEMPFNLAVFDVNAAEGIQEQYPQIESWYIGGHSLGGSMAAAYLADCEEEFEGLILLGSYSTAELTDSDLEVLSVYGSEDKVLNHEKYKANKVNLPTDFEEVILEGGCHAYFGMYGAQEGDGTPVITNEEQIDWTTDAILALINEQIG